MILDQFIDDENNLLVKYESSNNIVNLKISMDSFTGLPVFAEINDVYDFDTLRLTPLSVTPNNYTQECWDLIQYIKDNPNLSNAAFNTYLSGLDWAVVSAIKVWLRETAEQLAVLHGVNIGNMTENNVLAKMKQWVIDTPNGKIKRLLFNNFNS